MIRRLGRLAALTAMAAALLITAGSAAAVAAPRIVLRAPHAWQVVQRGRDDRADLVVSGRLVGANGSVRVAWGAARTTVDCGAGGRFVARLVGVPAGQADLVVRSARLPGVVSSRRCVGVGDIYVIAGQSNASGRSLSLYSYSSPTLRAAMFGNDYRWHELRDPVDSPEGQVDVVSRDMGAGGSVWPEVATELLATEGVPVAFVPCARVGTPIARWRRDLTSPRPGGTLYASLARRVAAVGGNVRAVLWWQGERDARERTAPSVYQASLQRLAADVWRDFGAPMVVAQIGDYGSAYPDDGVDGVRLAQQQAWGRSHILEGPVLYDVDLSGQVHVAEPDDVVSAARRWAAAILRTVHHRAAGRPPRLVLAVREGDELVLTADAPLAAGADVGGFVISNNGREIPIERACVDGTTVRLLLRESVEGAPSVSLGQGRSAAGAAVPTDTSVWRLPMLPFVNVPVVAGE